MKKMFALFLALIMVLSFTACGSNAEVKTEATTEAATEPQSLPVKFGSVTDVETTADKAEAIVLSMEEPSSSQGAERDVYIAAVDYIFTHASKDLAELSVTAYAPNGDRIISFTITSDIVANMKEVESQGSWGTAGFCAYYYMNHDAYDELVASISEANGWIQETTEPTAEAVVDYDTVAILLEATGVTGFDYWNVDVIGDVFFISFTMNGMDDGIELFKVAGYDETYSEWVSIKETMMAMYQSEVDLMKTLGVENPNCYLNLVSDKDHAEVLASIYNGEIVLDVMESE